MTEDPHPQSTYSIRPLGDLYREISAWTPGDALQNYIDTTEKEVSRLDEIIEGLTDAIQSAEIRRELTRRRRLEREASLAQARQALDALS